MIVTSEELWDEAEAAFERAQERTRELAEAIALHEIAAALLAMRADQLDAAEAALAAAIDDAIAARAELVAVIELAEQTSRLVAMRRAA